MSLVNLLIVLLFCNYAPDIFAYEFFAFAPGFQVIADNKTHSPVVHLIELSDTKKMYMPWGKTLQHIPLSTSNCIDRKYVDILTPEAFQKDGYNIDDKHWWVHDLHPKVFRRTCWPLITHVFGQRYTSKSSQDGLLEFIYHNIGVTNKYFVEFSWGKNEMSNSFNLQNKHNFTGLIMTRGNEFLDTNPYVKHEEDINVGNIVSLFQKYHVPKAFDFLSIELQSQEVWVLHALLEANYRPRILAIAYNVNFPMNSTIACDLHCPVPARGCRLYGASFGAINFVMEKYQYHLLVVAHRHDVIYIQKHLLKQVEIPPNIMYQGHFGPSHGKSCYDKFGSEGLRFVHRHALDYRGKHTIP